MNSMPEWKQKSSASQQAEVNALGATAVKQKPVHSTMKYDRKGQDTYQPPDVKSLQIKAQQEGAMKTA